MIDFAPSPPSHILAKTISLHQLSLFFFNISRTNSSCQFSLPRFCLEMASEIKNEGVFFRNWGWFKALSGKLGTKIVETTRKIKKLGQDDPRRIIHSLKFGLALTLVSLIYYFEPPYKGFGNSAMWAILTVIVVFEFSVG